MALRSSVEGARSITEERGLADAISLVDAMREWWDVPGINVVGPLAVLVVLGVVAVRTLRAPTVPVAHRLDTITRPM